MSEGDTPQAVVIAGCNGAGKTSAAPELLRDTVGIGAFVNADVIAEGLSGFSPASAAFQAGRIMVRRLEGLARAGADFAFESTLAGRSAFQLLTRLDRGGYEVHIFYLWLPSPDLVERVRGRVEAGGHDVPELVIRRRFPKSVVNFDTTSTWPRSGDRVGRPLIAHGARSGEPEVLD